ncbi:MAG: hypothetical protein ACREKB_07210 [Candidatus Rokuibacteriota bacterium]
MRSATIRRLAKTVAGFGLLAVLALALPGQGVGQPASVRRTIYMAAVEPRGGAAVTSEPFPTEALPPGPGYVLRRPDETGRWEVSGYYWQPGFLLANLGDDLTLEILGINGAEHPTVIEGINVPPFTVRRGQITRVNFRATRPGFYPIVCTTHLPSMVAYLVVLPRR